MSTALFNTLAQVTDAAAGGNPWLILGIIFGVMLLVAIYLLIPHKSQKSLEDEKESQKKSADKDDSSKTNRALTDGEDKSKLSLAELKESKRAAVSENRSKDELRELRKERRAATQTANAIHDREEIAHEEEDVAEDSGEELLTKTEAEDAEKDKMTAPIDDILTNSEAGASDVFASLFGTNKSENHSLKFDDIIGESSTPSNDACFPTLGSKLIPLNELMAAAAADEDNPEGSNLLDGLTEKIAGKAEKKTLA